LRGGTHPRSILQVEKQVQALSAQEIQVAAKRYFNEQNYVQVVLNPETQAAETVAATAKTVAPGG
jgi:zinc protease